MTRLEIITRFREECPEITERVISDSVLGSWCEIGDLEVACRARIIVGDVTFAAIVGQSSYDITAEEPKFYDCDEFPGGGVSFDDDRLDHTTIGELDSDEPSWRTNSNGTPDSYYRRGKYINFNRPPDATSDIQVYTVLKSDPFDDDAKTPFNQLTHLEPFHYAIVLYLIMRAKAKVGKPEERTAAMAEYGSYVSWIQKSLGGNKYGPISLHP